MRDVLKKIRDAEQRAHDQIEKARADSEAMLARAHEEVRQILAEAAARAHGLAAEKLRNACAGARIEADAIIRSGEGHAVSLKAHTQKLVEDAAWLIVHRIVGDA